MPCSYLTPFINDVIGSPALRYVGAANEGDAVAMAAGALGSLPAIAMIHKSGLGNAVSPLTSLTHTFRVPILLIVTWRGQPGGAADEPQHQLMGEVTPAMLETMRIPWALFPLAAAEIGPALDLALAQFAKESRPFALVMQKGSVAPKRSSSGARRPCRRPDAAAPFRAQRHDTATCSRPCSRRRARVLIATTGFTGRELFALGDRPNQLYMVGSMGCA